MNDVIETELPTAGQRLRAAREEKGITLEDVATQTRIPLRHLQSLETGSWEQLPAQTYSLGFARSYATTVGLDRTEIADQLRLEMGGQRSKVATAEVFEPADPARTMPKWLVFGAIAAVIVLVLLMSWLNERSLSESGEPVANEAVAAAPLQQAPAAAPVAQGPVAIAASEPVWISVRDGTRTLYSAELRTGQSYEVPATATAPVLTTGKPEALRISVGTASAPPIGPPATTVRNVSLRGADLMRGPAAGAPAAGVAQPGVPTPPAAQLTQPNQPPAQ
jgi:cytoskeletal protein RodZ